MTFSEWKRVLRDVRNGALPLHEIPGFFQWLLQGGAA